MKDGRLSLIGSAESDDDKETITSLIKLLHSLPTSVEHIIIDDNDDIPF